MKTHVLTNIAQYPRFHKHHASNAINIFANVSILKGDCIDIDGELYKLGTNKNINGLPKETENGNTSYYEFTIEKQN